MMLQIHNSEVFLILGTYECHFKAHNSYVFVIFFSFYRPAPSSPGQTNGINSTEQLVGRFQVSVQADALAATFVI